MTHRELEWLAEQAATHSRIVELGSFIGRSTRALADNTPGYVVAFDDWRGPRDNDLDKQLSKLDLLWAFKYNLRDHIETGKVKILIGDHGDPNIRIVDRPDMVFIDGDHTYEGAKRDMLIWKDRVAKGGMICGHDYSWDGVFQALREVFPYATNVPYTDIWRADA